MSKAEQFRREAKDARKRADQTRSLTEAVRERKREKGLEQLADNEDWLAGSSQRKRGSMPGDRS
jgi:hypothetical protein